MPFCCILLHTGGGYKKIESINISVKNNFLTTTATKTRQKTLVFGLFVVGNERPNHSLLYVLLLKDGGHCCFLSRVALTSVEHVCSRCWVHVWHIIPIEYVCLWSYDSREMIPGSAFQHIQHCKDHVRDTILTNIIVAIIWRESSHTNDLCNDIVVRIVAHKWLISMSIF